MLYKAKVVGIIAEPSFENPVVLLKTKDGNHTVSICIGLLEATSIASALRKVEFDRPMTHDLLNNLVEALNASVQKISICDVKDDTFFANIYILSDGHTFKMDARPSDAITLAVKLERPIFINECVIEKLGPLLQMEHDLFDTSPEGEKWAKYLEALSPNDFGKYKV